jgi:GH25 family lysozyme M1 (1,4-beta-N-acetylmuramidase)
MPSRAFLRASLALWRRRERYRKRRHDHWQRLLRRARNTHAASAVIASLVIKRDHWSKLLKEARESVELREKQLAVPVAARGIDVSNNNGHVDWKKVRAAGYTFAWLKASEGQTFTDRFFLQNVRGAQAAGLKVGAYHFLHNGNRAAQAKHFVALVRAAGLGKGDLLPVVDVEQVEGAPDPTPADAAAFADAVQRELRVRPLIYTFPSFTTCPSTFGCPLWIAHFGVLKPTIPKPWRRYAAWQHSSTAHVDGVSGNCDVNKTPDLNALVWR